MLKKISNYKADYIEIGFIKTSAMAFTLLIAKLWFQHSVWIGIGT